MTVGLEPLPTKRTAASQTHPERDSDRWAAMSTPPAPTMTKTFANSCDGLRTVSGVRATNPSPGHIDSPTIAPSVSQAASGPVHRTPVI